MFGHKSLQGVVLGVPVFVQCVSPQMTLRSFMSEIFSCDVVFGDTPRGNCMGKKTKQTKKKIN